jgi:hypothetical protein
MMTPAEQASERNAEDDIALSRLWPFARAAVPYWIARAERAEARLAECERERDTLRAVIANDCETEDLARAEAVKVLGAWAEGDTNDVPNVAALAERMAQEITRLRAALESRNA